MELWSMLNDTQRASVRECYVHRVAQAQMQASDAKFSKVRTHLIKADDSARQMVHTGSSASVASEPTTSSTIPHAEPVTLHDLLSRYSVDGPGVPPSNGAVTVQAQPSTSAISGTSSGISVGIERFEDALLRLEEDFMEQVGCIVFAEISDD